MAWCCIGVQAVYRDAPEYESLDLAAKRQEHSIESADDGDVSPRDRVLTELEILSRISNYTPSEPLPLTDFFPSVPTAAHADSVLDAQVIAISPDNKYCVTEVRSSHRSLAYCYFTATSSVAWITVK